jgi:omega-hydroxy-beta-dihydromenaquinone-9 sulfotransferase
VGGPSLCPAFIDEYDVIPNERPPDTLQPLAFGSFHNWLQLLRENHGVDREYFRRALFTTFVSAATEPLRLVERACNGRAIRSQRISEPPIFIIGHWRSGTALLHNLLSTDANLGFVTLFQTIAPELALVGSKTVKPLLRRFTPKTRWMDNVTLAQDGPEEEELAVANLSQLSFYHHLSFPRRAQFYFTRYALFRDVPDSVVERWKQVYLYVLRTATVLADGRRLVLKNPANTARLRLLLKLFPDAKFIHIYRNPYAVFPSTMHFYTATYRMTALQRIPPSELESNVLRFYSEMMRQYFADKSLIPPGNLIEVRYEDVEADPFTVVRQIYESLEIGSFERMARRLQAMVDANRTYQKNQYAISDDVTRKVTECWGFAADAWRYPARRAE